MVRAWWLVALAGCAAAPSDVAAFSHDPLSPRQGYMLDLGVPDAWQYARAPVVVAIVDTGVDLEHPDLQSSIWSNANEIADNGVDDDSDGHVDDVHGWSLLDDTANVALTAAELEATDATHGTKIAGTIAAATNNGIGVAGLCPICSLMILKGRDFIHANSSVPLLPAAVDYAIAHHARVLNVSDGMRLGTITDSAVAELEAAVERAERAGLVIVASAGNEASDQILWPARIPGVISVAAVDWKGRPTSFTNFGPQVTVAAPGVYIETTLPEAGYGYFTGTSAAAPIVSALAAMLISEHPEWTPAEITARIIATAHPARLDGRPDIDGFGAGIVDFVDALAPTDRS